MKSFLRVGIVGWGHIAREHARHLANSGARITGIVSRRSDLNLPFCIYHSIEEMLPNVDAITTAVPNHLHAASCIKAVRAGKAVMAEKPICITPEELQELEALLPAARVPVHLGYRLRWNPSMLALRQKIKGLKAIRCIYRFGIERLAENRSWTRKSTLSGGGFFTLGVHMLDLARWLAHAKGEPLTNLNATARHRDDSADFPLYVTLSGVLPSGVAITAGTDLRGDMPSHIDLSVEAVAGRYPDATLPPPVPADENIEYAALFDNFVGAVATRTYDADGIREVLQTHRELLRAAQLVA